MRREESEIAFSGYDHEIQQWISTWMYVWANRLVSFGCAPAGSTGGFISNCEVSTGLGRVSAINYRTPKGQIEMVDITVTFNQGWKPLIIVSGTYVEPQMVALSGNPDEDMARIKEQVLFCFERAGIDMREPFVEHNLPAGANPSCVWWG